jgi:hypothetical protein
VWAIPIPSGTATERDVRACLWSCAPSFYSVLGLKPPAETSVRQYHRPERGNPENDLYVYKLIFLFG